MTDRARAGALDGALCALLVAVLSFVLAELALGVFDFFDMSAFLDAGWRVASGQVPYVDFQFNAGPVHLYLHALAMALFGVSRAAILAYLVVANAVVVVVAWVLARRHLDRLSAVLVTLLASLCFFGPIAHPWYDQTASLWLLLGALLVEFLPVRRPWAIAGAAGLGLLVALAFLTKANVGLGAGLTFLLALAAMPHRRLTIPAYALAIPLGALLILLPSSPAGFVTQTLVAYRPADRALDVGRLVAVLLQTPYAMLAALALGLVSLGGRAYARRHRRRLAVLAGMLATSVFAAWTGSMRIEANIVLAGVETGYLLVLARALPGGGRGTSEARISRTAVAGVTLCAVYLLVAAVLMSNSRLAWTWKASNLDADWVFETPALRGWQCHRPICEGVDRAVAYIDRNVPRGDPLFVFPDATIVYGLTHHESYRKAPFLFHLGVMPLPGAPYGEFRARFLQEPPRWILLHEQAEVPFYDTRVLLRWLALDDFVRARYRTVWQWGDFSLLRLDMGGLEGPPIPPGARTRPGAAGARLESRSDPLPR